MEENIIIKKIRPLYTKVVLTKDMYTDAPYVPGTNIIDATKVKQGLKELQHVVAVGTSVRDIKEGDLVCIDPSRYAIRKYSKKDTKEAMEEYANSITGYAFPEIELNGKPYLYLDERDIDFVVEEYTELKN